MGPQTPAPLPLRMIQPSQESQSLPSTRILSWCLSPHNLLRRGLDPVTLNLATDAEVNPPIIRPLNTFGNQNRVDPLITGEGWKKPKTIGQEEGLVTAAYDKSNERWNRRVHQFALNHVWSPIAAMTGYPASMKDGATKLLAICLDNVDGELGHSVVLQEAYRRPISDDPSEAWTSGQWITERTGGSDVRETKTLTWRLMALPALCACS